MNAQVIFAKHITASMDTPCPATQDAIDRIVKGEEFRGRSGLIEAMNGPHYRPADFCSALLSAWTQEDIMLATGRSRDWWLDLLAA